MCEIVHKKAIYGHYNLIDDHCGSIVDVEKS